MRGTKNAVNTPRFDQLRERIAAVLERCAQLHGDCHALEGRLAKKDRETGEIRKKLEAALQERENLRLRIGGIIDKIESLDI
jgi:chromosome segregation ATPase